MSSNKIARPLKRVKDVALYITLHRALKQYPRFIRWGRGSVLLHAPEGYEPKEYATALLRVLFPYDEYVKDMSGYMYIEVGSTASRVISDFETECANKDRALVIAEAEALIPALIEIGVDVVADLSPMTARDLRIACRAALGLRMTQAQSEKLITHPHEYIWAALRRGREIDAVLRRLSEVAVEIESQATPKRSREVPPLAEMHGYGEARAWGEQLATDLCDWSNGKIRWDEVDSGLILSGPPGVGKTIFAKALAAECGVALVTGSLGKWQATGHLGDTLKAMRAAFAQAKKSVPSILFIDEIDSFGDRAKFPEDHKNYSTQVVNSLLEQLDGIDGREGVITIAATNHPHQIDPAILRAGRLDRHIQIDLPDAVDRIAILASLLDEALTVSELDIFKPVTSGLTGADLSKVARDAKRLARREKRPVQLSDLESSLPASFKIEGEFRHYISVHEAGHTVVGVDLKHGQYLGTRIANCIPLSGETPNGGAAYFELPPVARRDRQYFLDRIAVTLAGIAAEEIVTGAFGDGASSDLASATRLATLVEARLGMGHSLRHSQAFEDAELEKLRLNDLRLADRVDETLKEQFERAKGILASKRPLLDLVTQELFHSGVLSPARFQELAGAFHTDASETLRGGRTNDKRSSSGCSRSG